MNLSLALLPAYGRGPARAPRFARLRSALTGMKAALRRNPSLYGALACVIGIWGFALLAIAAVVTHVVWCIKAGAWLLLIAGIVPFVSFVHGIMIWLGQA